MAEKREIRFTKSQIEKLKNLGVIVPEEIIPVKVTGVEKVLMDLSILIGKNKTADLKLMIQSINKVLVSKGKGIGIWLGNKENLEKYNRLLV